VEFSEKKIMIKILIPALAVLAVLAVLSGCASKEVDVDVEQDGPPTEDTMPILDETAMQDQDGGALENTPSIIAASDAEMNAISDEALSPQAMLEEKNTPLSTRLIYFEYNSAKINVASLATLESHGDFISENGKVHVRLEGHSDERGSREFNVALGDRRNQSVRRLLLFQGASTDQIDTVSYGEELPAILGHNDEAWSKNRRVELVYTIKN